MVAETVYISRDNTNDLLLKSGGAAQDLSAVTRMVLSFDSTAIDSDVSGDAFDWDTGITGKVVLDLGGESVNPGTYAAILIVYDAINTNGIVWGEVDLVFVSS